MEWIDINKQPAPVNMNVLVVINRKRAGKSVEQEIHVGHRNNNFWVIGNQFGFDMGEVTHWMLLPRLP